MSNWQTICVLEDIIPGTGICALVNEKQVAVFRPTDSEQVFAISNCDPFAQSNVLSRGLICEHKGDLWVASPLKKQHFRLKDGLCLEDEYLSVESYSSRVVDGMIEILAAAKFV